LFRCPPVPAALTDPLQDWPARLAALAESAALAPAHRLLSSRRRRPAVGAGWTPAKG